jgi:hypothetical protein
VGRGAPNIGPEVDALCLVFSRDETAPARVGRSVDDLMLLTDDDRLRRQLAHGVFFSFDGWDDDPREIFFIPECRSYLRELHAQWPYWLHFLAPVPELWSVLLLCLADPELAGEGEPGKLPLSLPPGQLRRIVGGMLAPMNLLHEQMGLHAQQRQQIFEGSIGAIQQLLG